MRGTKCSKGKIVGSLKTKNDYNDGKGEITRQDKSSNTEPSTTPPRCRLHTGKTWKTRKTHHTRKLE